MNDLKQNSDVLALGSCRPKWSGVPRAGIRDCASDEDDFSLVTALLATVQKSNSRKQGNTLPSNRTLRSIEADAGHSGREKGKPASAVDPRRSAFCGLEFPAEIETIFNTASSLVIVNRKARLRL